MDYQEINARTIDRWIEEGWEWGKPIPHETFLAAQAGKWDVVLTPTKPVPHSWFGDLHERLLAEREGYPIEMIRADMSKPLPFEDERFDLIFHPVSNVYIREVLPVWRECFRILKYGGVLLAGLDNGLNFAFTAEEGKPDNTLPFDPLTHPEQMAQLEAENDGIQFSHTIEEQIGGQLAAGFRLTDVYGDTDGIGPLHEHNIPTYWATRAVKE